MDGTFAPPEPRGRGVGECGRGRNARDLTALHVRVPKAIAWTRPPPPRLRPPPAEGVDRAMLALAEAIIPGTSTIPGADDTTVREVTELVSRLSPKLARAWTAAHRALDAAARLRTGRPFHALSAARQDALLARWERDPLVQDSAVAARERLQGRPLRRATRAARDGRPAPAARARHRAALGGAGPGGRIVDGRRRRVRRGGHGDRGWRGGGGPRARRARTRGGLRRGRTAPSPAPASTGAWFAASSASTGPRSPWETRPSRCSWGAWWVAPPRSTAGPRSGRHRGSSIAGARRWAPTPSPPRGWSPTSTGWRLTSGWLRRRCVIPGRSPG